MRKMHAKDRSDSHLSEHSLYTSYLHLSPFFTNLSVIVAFVLNATCLYGILRLSKISRDFNLCFIVHFSFTRERQLPTKKRHIHCLLHEISMFSHSSISIK